MADNLVEQKDVYVRISYFLDGNLLCTIFSEVYPQYREGQTLELRLVPTNRERVRRPKQRFKAEAFVITAVHHIMEQHERDENHFYLQLEVVLRKPPATADLPAPEIDTNGTEIDTA